VVKSQVVLVCKRVVFYELKDEQAFFEWLKKIKSIQKIDDQFDKVFLYFKTNNIAEQDLRDLLALFFRYKINMKQLAVFLNQQNAAWFYDQPQMYWHKKVFGKKA
jgi:hypothetical protein